MNYSSTQASFDFGTPLPPPLISVEPATTTSQTELTRVPTAKGNIQRILVDPIRLDEQGDITRSYSGDCVDNGKIRRPFRYNGKLCVCTSSLYGTTREATAYYLTPKHLFDGEPTTYAVKILSDHGETARSDPNGFYHGITINHQGQPYVLAGPKLTFVSADAT